MKYLRYLSLQTKLIILFCATFLLTIVYIISIEMRTMYKFTDTVKKGELTLIADGLTPSLAANIELGLNANNKELLSHTLQLYPFLNTIELHDYNGQTLRLSKSQQTHTEISENHSANIIAPYGANLGKVVFFYNDDRWKHIQQDYFSIIISILTVMIVFMLIAVLLLRTLFSPFGTLVNKIKHYNADKEENPFERCIGYDEVGKVERQLYEMIESNIRYLNQTRNLIQSEREKEQMLLQQSKLASMGEMIGNIAHQWRQPLSQISGLMMNIQMRHELGKLDDTYLEEKILQSEKLVGYMSQTIDDFRNFFKPDKTKHIFNVGTIITESLGIISSSLTNYHIHVDDHHIQKNVFIDGYPSEFAQVLLILLGNAKDVIAERNIPDGLITITLEEKEGRALLSIYDNGGGIHDEILNKIFDPYFSTKHQSQGTGLGLYMAKIIIEKNMLGNLSVTNTKEGACFTISIDTVANNHDSL